MVKTYKFRKGVNDLLTDESVALPTVFDLKTIMLLLVIALSAGFGQEARRAGTTQYQPFAWLHPGVETDPRGTPQEAGIAYVSQQLGQQLLQVFERVAGWVAAHQEVSCET